MNIKNLQKRRARAMGPAYELFYQKPVHLVRGDGVWLFEPLGETACKVSLNLNFEFSSKLISITLGPVFSKVANSLVDAFIKRADTVYG